MKLIHIVGLLQTAPNDGVGIATGPEAHPSSCTVGTAFLSMG